MSLADFRIQVDAWIQDTAQKLTPADKDLAITTAVDMYSRHKPRQKVAILTGDGTAFAFAVPTDWVEDVSSPISIEHPVDQQQPQYLDESDYTVRRDPATGKLRIHFYSLTLPTGERAYLTYGIGHAVSAQTDTVPAADRLAVSKLAGAGCALQLAALYAQTSDPTMGADTVNYRTKSQDYLALATALETAYRLHVGVTDGVSAASVSTDLDVDLQNFAGPPFYHSNLDR